METGIRKSSLLIIGQLDRTVLGKDRLEKAQAAKHGKYPLLGKWLQSADTIIQNWLNCEVWGIFRTYNNLKYFQKLVLDFLK